LINLRKIIQSVQGRIYPLLIFQLKIYINAKPQTYLFLGLLRAITANIGDINPSLYDLQYNPIKNHRQTDR